MIDIVPLLELLDLLAVLNIHLSNYIKIKKMWWGWMLSSCSITYFIFRSLCLSLIAQSFGHMVSLALAMYGAYRWKFKNEDHK